MSRRGHKWEAKQHAQVGVHNLAVASEGLISLAAAASGIYDPCKHSVVGPCPMCAREDREHDAAMAAQVAGEAFGQIFRPAISQTANVAEAGQPATPYDSSNQPPPMPDALGKLPPPDCYATLDLNKKPQPHWNEASMHRLQEAWAAAWERDRLWYQTYILNMNAAKMLDRALKAESQLSALAKRVADLHADLKGGNQHDHTRN